jgi:hypothetical protein
MSHLLCLLFSILILNDNWQPDRYYDLWEFWVAKIIAIRGNGPWNVSCVHVLLQICLLMLTDLGEGAVVLFREGHCRKGFFYVSTDATILSLLLIDLHTSGIHLPMEDMNAAWGVMWIHNSYLHSQLMVCLRILVVITLTNACFQGEQKLLNTMKAHSTRPQSPQIHFTLVGDLICMKGSHLYLLLYISLFPPCL